MAFFVRLGEVSDALDIIQNGRLYCKDVRGRLVVRFRRRLVGAGKSSSDGRHGFGLFLCSDEKIGLWDMRGNVIRWEGEWWGNSCPVDERRITMVCRTFFGFSETIIF